MYVLGIDEAGYGPTLGPLVVAGTLWHCEPRRVREDFWSALSDCVCRRAVPGEWRLPVDDSKAVFDRKRGLGSLERSVLAFADVAGVPARDLGGFLRAIGADPAPETTTRIPWYGDLSHPLPLDRTHGTSRAISARLGRALAGAGLECRGLFARIVTEDRFNDRVRQTRNKSALVVEQVLNLMQHAGGVSGRTGLLVRVDRLGGRADYRNVLLTAFGERELRVLELSEGVSRYRMTGAESTWHVEFAVDADQHHLPVALASMVAKYVRELIMEQFNAFWRRWHAELRPTAGYYGDAQRFLRDIEPFVASAGVPSAAFVRAR